MKSLLLSCILLISSVFLSSQNFRRDYTLFSIYENGRWQSPERGSNTFVFNANQQNDIYLYPTNGGRIVFKKTTGIKKDYTKDGYSFQMLGALDDDGKEILIQLFDDSRFGLKILYLSGSMIQFFN